MPTNDYEVNWTKFDLDQDGEVTVQDSMKAIELGLPASLAECIQRYVLGTGPVIPQYDINGDLIPDWQMIEDYGSLIYQGTFDLNADGSFGVADTQKAIQDGWPWEMLAEMYQTIYGGNLPAETMNLFKTQWEETLPGGSGNENPNLSWYPLPHNPLLPISSLPEPPPPPPPNNDDEIVLDDEAMTQEPGSNPAEEPPPIDPQEWHPLDFNQDGVVSFPDLLVANGTYGQTVGMMVYRYLMGGNPYDIDENGIVDIHDLLTAQTQGVPENILYHMQAQVMNPPDPVIDYEPEPEQEAPTEPDGSAYHPLDFNQDGIVNVNDLVAVAISDLSQSAKSMINTMIEKYIAGINPYDINGDGIVNVVDINEAVQVGVPQIIIEDIVANVGSSAPLPPVVLPEPPPTPPGPTLVEENLYVEPGEYVLLNGTPYHGPVHRIYNNIGEYFMTEKIHKNHSRVLLALTTTPEPPMVETPPGQANLPSVFDGSITNNQLGAFTQETLNTLGALGATVSDLNNDGIIDILDLIQQNNQGGTGSSGNQTGGAPSNNNNTTNNNSGGGGGAY